MGRITNKEVKTSEIGCLENETRATFIVNKRILNAFKRVAYWERMQLKDAICQAMELFVKEKLESYFDGLHEEEGIYIGQTGTKKIKK